MRKLLFAAAFAAMCSFQALSISAQTFGAAPAGRSINLEAERLRNKTYGDAEVEGSPFMKDDWVSGIAVPTVGENYQGNLKYDMAKDQLVYAGKENEPMTFGSTIKRFTLGTDVYESGYPAVDSWNTFSFYKTLGTGKNRILKHYYKKKLEKKDVNGLTAGYMYEDNIATYMFKDGQMIHIKPNKSGILGALADKKEQVEAYAKTNKIDFKKDEDLTKLMDYYSSL